MKPWFDEEGNIDRAGVRKMVKENTKPVDRTPLTNNQLALMAAILGVSNSGSDHLFNGPRAEWTVEKVKRHFAGCKLTVDGVTTSIVMSLCENEEMLDMFLEEARSWESRLRQLSVEAVKANWTRYAAFVECV